MTYLTNQARNMLVRIELFVDVLLTALTYIIVYTIKRNLLTGPFGGLTDTPNYFLLLMLIIFIWYVTFNIVNVKYGYSPKMTSSMVIKLFKGVTISTSVLVLCMYILKITDISRLLILMFYLADLIVLNLTHLIIHRITSSTRRDYSSHHVLILGSRSTAQDLIRIITNHASNDIIVVGCIEINQEEVGKDVCCGIQVIGTLEDLRDILLHQVVDEVLVTMPLNEIKNSEWYLSFISTFGITIRIIPYWYIRKFMSIHPSQSFQVEHFLSEPALSLNMHQEKNDAMIIKSIIDYVLAIFALIITLPLFVIIPCLIKLFSPGPVFYKQLRCGRYGRKFFLIKFRTMVPNAEDMQNGLLTLNEASGPAFKIKNDPRIIPYIGTLLRKISLDELPQFLNVIRGDMSLVGPRPPIPAEVEKYELWQRRRLSMKPGITCIWQIQPRRNEIPFDRWVNMDMAYIDHWSLKLDIILILKTIPAILFGRGR